MKLEGDHTGACCNNENSQIREQRLPVNYFYPSLLKSHDDASITSIMKRSCSPSVVLKDAELRMHSVAAIVSSPDLYR